MSKFVPCREPLPDLPRRKKPRSTPDAFGPEEIFAFDTETTWDGVKSLRSYQAAWLEGGILKGCVLYLDGWYSSTNKDTSHEKILLEYGCDLEIKSYKSESSLRRAVQIFHEKKIYGSQPLKVKGRKRKRTVERCAVAFNGNFDYGVMSDGTILYDEMRSGVMEGSGVKYYFTSGKRKSKDKTFGLDLEALYLGADNVPYMKHRGLLWELSVLTNHIWGCKSLSQVGDYIGVKKLEADFNDLAYGFVDAIITLRAAIEISEDLQNQGFQGMPDRFVSGAAVSKDLMKQYYEPFYLEWDEHTFVWPAYFGGMTGATRPKVITDREPFFDCVYGDLDGAYSASAQKLKIFNWDGVRWLNAEDVERIVNAVRIDPSLYWHYGSLHIEVEGDFDRVPIRIAKVGDKNEETRVSTTHGLIWGKMKNYSTTLTLGDYLMSKPNRHKIVKGLIANEGKEQPDLFKMCADERKKFKSGTVSNRWWKLAGNCIYGSFANRNGKLRTEAGPWFNSIIASSITGAIRYCMWTINDAVGKDCHYNDTDSGLMYASSFLTAQDSLKPLDIGFSNKTNEEIGVDIAALTLVQGSKRYAMLGKDGQFGAKCHGLGSWFVLLDGKVQSVAHNKKVLKTVWQICYPEYFGYPDEDIMNLNVFHKYSIRSRTVSDMVKGYCVRQMGLKDATHYGKAGNFGFLCPSVVKGKVKPIACWDKEEADKFSNITLGEVAISWKLGIDAKYDYDNSVRWSFDGSEVRTVEPIPHTQDLMAAQGALMADISVEVEI